jgi:hypothetical protein
MENMELNYKVKSPILLITYKRLGTAKQVFEKIRAVQPEKLYFASNAAQPGMSEEILKVESVRSLINLIDWPCHVYTLYRSDHLSAKYSISSAIDWFFEHEEMGIILEDDCLPHPTFFRFCDELLERYRDDNRVALICGTNLPTRANIEDSYYFSRYPHIWGWASWRRVWSKYDLEMKDLHILEKNVNFKGSFVNKAEWKYWLKNFKAVQTGKINTWDAQVVYLTFIHGMLSIYPAKNLISNIGCGDDATHTTDKDNILANLKTYAISFPMKNPQFILPNLKAELDRKKLEAIGLNSVTVFIKQIIKKIGIK